MNAFLENIHLLRPWALLLVGPAFVLWWLGRRAADTTRRWARVMDPDLLKLLVVGGTTGRRLGPTDLAPTRLDRARQKIADLLKAREGGAAGLIAYSGSAHLVLPPTADSKVVLAMAGALAPQIMPREGDRLADAVALAAQVLRDGGKGGSILIVADTVAPGQAAAVKAITGVPLVFFAVAPPASVEADKALQAAVSALDARLIETTIDNDDVEALARRLADRSGAAAPAGETERWQETGYWLSFLIAALVLAWFRRGWVIST